jgi:LAO/AO transport system kinase
MDLIDRLLAGDEIAASKLISMVENKSPEIPEVMKLIHPHTGKAKTVGFTGPPGVGKSSLIDCFVKACCKRYSRVGVIAVDSTSPFTGGALLGDRIRMGSTSSQEKVFFRSMATRGCLGGLAEASKRAIRILDALGCHLIIVETVGVGQVELDIVKAVDTVILVTMPATGDAIQVMKAGIMEIADVFAVNKADILNADIISSEIQRLLDMTISDDGAWKPPVVLTSATEERGIEKLYQAVEDHYTFLTKRGLMEKRKKEQICAELSELVLLRLQEDFIAPWIASAEFMDLVDRVYCKETDHFKARDLAVNNIRGVLLQLRPCDK